MDVPSPRNGAPLLSSPFARHRVARTPCPTVSLQAAVLPWPLPLVASTAVDAALDPLSTVGLAPSVLRHLSAISGSAVRLRLHDQVSGCWRERIVQAVLMDAPTTASAQRCAYQTRYGGRGALAFSNEPKLAKNGRSTRNRQRSMSPDANTVNMVWVPPGLLYNLGVQPHDVSLLPKGQDTSSQSTSVSATGARHWTVTIEVSPAGWRKHGADDDDDTDGSVSDSSSADGASSSADEGHGSGPSSRSSAGGGGSGDGGSRSALVACPPELRRAGVGAARLAVVARVRAPGPSSSGHANYASALGRFFDTPRLLALGDVFSVPVSHLHRGHHEASTVAAPRVVYFTVVALESNKVPAQRALQGKDSTDSGNHAIKHPALWLSKELTMLMQEGACNCAVPDPRLAIPFLAPPSAGSTAAAPATAAHSFASSGHVSSDSDDNDKGDGTASSQSAEPTANAVRARRAVLEDTCAAACPQPVDELCLTALLSLLRPLAPPVGNFKGFPSHPSPPQQPSPLSTQLVGSDTPSGGVVEENTPQRRAATSVHEAAQAAAQEHATSRCAVLLHGRSGSGKSQLAVRAATQLGFKVVRLRLNLAAGGYGPTTPSSFNENEDDEDADDIDGGSLDDDDEKGEGGSGNDGSESGGAEGRYRGRNRTNTNPVRTSVASSALGRDAAVVSAIEAAFAEAAACAPCVLLLQGLEALGAASHGSGAGGGGGSGGGGAGSGNGGANGGSSGPLPASHPAAAVARCLDGHAAANAAAAHWALSSSSLSGFLGANTTEQPEVRRVVVLGTCVSPNDVGEPLRRCFTHELAVPPPSEALRLQLLQHHLWPRLENSRPLSRSSGSSSKSAEKIHRDGAENGPTENSRDGDEDAYGDGNDQDKGWHLCNDDEDASKNDEREREALIALSPSIAQELVGRGARDVVALIADAQRRACLRSFNSATCTSASPSAGATLFDLALGRSPKNTIRSSSNVASISTTNTSTNTSNLITAADLRAALKALPPPRDRAVASIKVPEVRWADVGGLAYVRHEIMAVLNLPRLHPELFSSGSSTSSKPRNGVGVRSGGAGGGVPRLRSAVLLFGPPGTGKTLVAKAVATECGYPFLSVKGPELLDVYVGESEKNVREVFAAARAAAPCVVFFDELDSLAPARGRGSDSGGVMDRVVSQLLTEVDSVAAGHSSSSNSSNDSSGRNDSSSNNQGGGQDDQDTKPAPLVLVMGATNRPDLLDPSLFRPGRFDKLLYLGIPPEPESKETVLKAVTRQLPLDATVDLAQVARSLPPTFSGADTAAVASSALGSALRRKAGELEQQVASYNAKHAYGVPLTVPALLRKLQRRQSSQLVPTLLPEDFEAAAATVAPSVSLAELKHYETLRARFSTSAAVP